MKYIRNNLAVCGFHHIGSRADFESHGFRVQLQCTEHYDPWLAECVEVMAAPFHDGAPIPKDLFHSAQGWLAGHWDSGCKILISCAAGQSRSVTMAIALLARKSGQPFLAVAQDVIARVPDAYPHPYVLVSAAAFCNQPLRLEELEQLYAAAPNQPAYPWSRELLSDAASLIYDEAFFESRLHLPHAERSLEELEWELNQGSTRFWMALDLAQDPGPDGFARFGEWESALKAEIARRKTKDR
jgi:hypothetical protein